MAEGKGKPVDRDTGWLKVQANMRHHAGIKKKKKQKSEKKNVMDLNGIEVKGIEKLPVSKFP